MTTTSSSTSILHEEPFSTSSDPMTLQDPPTPVTSNQSSPRVLDVGALIGANGIPSIPQLPIANGYHGHGTTKNGTSAPLDGDAPSVSDFENRTDKSTMSPPRQPRFSSATDEPIIVHRSTILSSSSSSPQRRSDQGEEGRDSSLSPFSFYNDGDRIGLTTNSNGSMQHTSRPTEMTSATRANSLYSLQNLSDWNVFILFLCDFLKSQTHLRVLRQSLESILRMELPGGPFTPSIRSSSTSSLPLGGPGVAPPTPTSRRRQRARNWLQRRRPVRISGLPNLGQTCFLNSVLQSLASLPPFLAYLDGITQYQQDMRDSGLVPPSGGDSASSSSTLAESDSFSQQLLGLLLAINDDGGGDDDDDEYDCTDSNGDGRQTTKTKLSGHHRPIGTTRQRRRLDPKGLLRKIGETNQQFKSSSSEQQDAQELLQALLEVVIADAQLDSSTVSSAYNIYRGLGPEGGEFASTRGDVVDYVTNGLGDDDVDDRLMTAVLANVVEDAGSSSTSDDDCFLSRSNSADGSGLVLDPYRDCVLSLSGFLLRMEEEQNIAAAETSGNSLNVLAAIKPSIQLAESTRRQELHEVEQENPLEEEKKQEHVEYQHNPSLSTPIPPQLTKHVEVNGNGYSHMTRQSVPTMARCTISSITPSPLSGWIGSTLRCSRCKHVRPIQNAPFLDIPLVPTSVPNYLAKAYHSGPKIVAPNAPTVPSCSLDECLADFTSVERVQDVECRSCTIRREVDHWEEEVMMLLGAVETSEKRRRPKNGLSGDGRNNVEDPCQYLRQDLVMAQTKLLQFKTMDPDEDDLSGALETTTSPWTGDAGSELLMGIDEDKKVQQERCEAKKCLLFTRTPSILCCHIQRRYYDPFTNRMEKCLQFVEFPETLDLSPYCAYGPRASTPWAAGASSIDDGDDGVRPKPIVHSDSIGGKMPYRLQSIIEHRGNAFGGHYVSYRRDDSGEWFRISDDTVTNVQWRDVRTCQAYMLFYEAI